MSSSCSTFSASDRRSELGGRAVRVAPRQPETSEDQLLQAAGFDVLGDLDQPREIRPEIGWQRPLGVGLDLGSHLLQLAALDQEVRSLRGDPIGAVPPDSDRGCPARSVR